MRRRRRSLVVAIGVLAALAIAAQESGEADLGSAATEEARRNEAPGILIPAAIAWMRVFGDDVVDRSPMNEARRLGTRPLQVVHGTADKRAPVHHPTDLEAVLQEANPASRAWSIRGDQHVQGRSWSRPSTRPASGRSSAWRSAARA